MAARRTMHFHGGARRCSKFLPLRHSRATSQKKFSFLASARVRVPLRSLAQLSRDFCTTLGEDSCLFCTNVCAVRELILDMSCLLDFFCLSRFVGKSPKWFDKIFCVLVCGSAPNRNVPPWRVLQIPPRSVLWVTSRRTGLRRPGAPALGTSKFSSAGSALPPADSLARERRYLPCRSSRCA